MEQLYQTTVSFDTNYIAHWIYDKQMKSTFIVKFSIKALNKLLSYYRYGSWDPPIQISLSRDTKGAWIV